MTTYRARPAAQDRLLRAVGGDVDRFVQGLGRRTRGEALNISRARLERRTGQYDGGFYTHGGAHPAGPSTIVGNSSPVSLILEEGSRPHAIVPRGPGYPLRFQVAGRTVFAWRVWHPGTRPYNVLKDALARVVAAIR